MDEAKEGEHRRYNDLPKAETDAIETSFNNCDRDGSGFLNHSEVIRCLREVGLQGTCAAEKREILRVCKEATDGAQQRCGADCNEAEAVAVDLLTFALEVVPRVRQTLKDLNSNELLRLCCQFDRNGSGRLSYDQCREIARSMGVNRSSLMKEIDSRFKNGFLDFQKFQDIVAKSREQSEREVREQEQLIKQTTGIPDGVFEEFRADIVCLHDLFAKADKDATGTLSWREAKMLLHEFGLVPKSFKERRQIDEMLKAVDENTDQQLSFGEFLELSRLVRSYQQEKNRAQLQECFHRHDRDGNGKLTMQELSSLLGELGCAPRTREEQEELAQLYVLVDADGSGFIDFAEFRNLAQRIDEKLRGMRHEHEEEYAKSIGFSDETLRDLRWCFESLDSDGSGQLDKLEARQAFSIMRLQVSQEAFESAFAALDIDRSGELSFREFLDLMRLLRDSEGLFAPGGSEVLPSQVRFLHARVLRRTLEYFDYSKSHINSLDKSMLIKAFCDGFGIKTTDNLHEKLLVTNTNELYEAAVEQNRNSNNRLKRHTIS
jgi:calmodulin